MALASYQAGRAVLQKLADANPAVARYHLSLAQGLSAISAEMHMMQRPDEALASCREALTILRRLVAANPTLTDFQAELGTCLETLAGFQSLVGKPEEALTALSVRAGNPAEARRRESRCPKFPAATGGLPVSPWA